MGVLRMLLQTITLQVDMEDRWLWNLESSHVFYVRSAYNLLTSQPQAGTPVDTKLFWHKDIPLKVVIFV